MDNIIRFSVSLPEQLLVELDKKVESQGYASRSEFTRDLIREKIVKDSWDDKNENLVGVLTVVYNHHQSDLLQKMMDVQHKTKITVLCTTHVHLEEHNCLETIMLRGAAKEIESLSQKISSLKGVKFSKLTKAAVIDA